MSAGPVTPFVVLALGLTVALLGHGALLLRSGADVSRWRGLLALSLAPILCGAVGALAAHMAGLDWVVMLGPAFIEPYALEVREWITTCLLAGGGGSAVAAALAFYGRCRATRAPATTSNWRGRGRAPDAGGGGP